MASMTCGLTSDNIYDLYFKYVCQKYGTNSIFGFDGYTEMPSTKDTARIRCSKDKYVISLRFQMI